MWCNRNAEICRENIKKDILFIYKSLYILNNLTFYDKEWLVQVVKYHVLQLIYQFLNLIMHDICKKKKSKYVFLILFCT